ncbi:MAG: helix-turn-helix transcriptional regulator [Rhodobacteraceae bacterium]|nr:helix-turn-helix transcriptional regulator [Paracoccaceae bacterium]
MIARDDSDILIALADAVREQAAWGKVLDLLRSQMQASRATLYTENAVLGDSVPRPACFAALRPNRVYTAEELADRAGPFDPDFGTGDSRVIAAAGRQATLWLHRARGNFRAADSARLSGLMPHITQALALAEDRAALAVALADAQTLTWRAGLGQIGPEGPDATAARLLRDAGCAAPLVAAGATRALPGGLSAYGLPDGCVLLRAKRDLPAPERLAPALGLTLSEARLARAIAQGESLAKASAALGLTRETGRSYAKQIYAKTGVSGQSGLVRLLWSGALAFGQGN